MMNRKNRISTGLLLCGAFLASYGAGDAQIHKDIVAKAPKEELVPMPHMDLKDPESDENFTGQGDECLAQ
ncbi:hypothetical protein [Rubritalea tangerina]